MPVGGLREARWLLKSAADLCATLLKCIFFFLKARSVAFIRLLDPRKAIVIVSDRFEAPSIEAQLQWGKELGVG